jgi:putative ATPase
MSVSTPLAERMRPKKLEDYFGQQHLLQPGASLRKAIDAGVLPSMIFWGPPGVGKTSLAFLIAQLYKRPFHTVSAINSGVKEIREIIQKAEQSNLFQSGGGAILFIDEIHRFSKSQQDSLLAAVEKGIVTLIGATTENPSFEVISALLSRCQVYVLEHLKKEELERLLQHAIEHDEILAGKEIALKETHALLHLSGGDARKLLNIFELVVGTFSGKNVCITDDLVYSSAQQNVALYDKSGEQHYDIISAFIKSIRGSDANAAVYWLARMVEGGEDPKFIARRMLILASEDIGMANPTAFIMANNCFQAVEVIGWPESRIILSQCAIYLANSPKGNASYMAIGLAQEEVKKSGNLPVPLHLRNAPTKLMKELGYGEEYKYAHLGENNFTEQEYLPETISGTSFYKAGSASKEKEVEEKLKMLFKGKYRL